MIYCIQIVIVLFLVEHKTIKTLDNIVEVKAKVKAEITVMKEKLTLARETIGRFKAELNKVQGNTPTS